MKLIYEMPIYDGRTKVWRVLNLNSNTFYCLEYEEQEEAFESIDDGAKRAGREVKAIRHISEVIGMF